MDIKLIPADTHTSEYMMHKYWARKPHNVISYFLKKLVPENGYVLDPFMGSGVVIKEAINLNYDAIGIDLNPVAFNISSVLTSPPLKKDFENIVFPILRKIEEQVSDSFSLTSNEEIRYIIHSTLVRCPNCHNTLETADCICEKKKFYCNNCHELLHFNLENLIDTNIVGICITDPTSNLENSNSNRNKKKTKIIYDEKEIHKQILESHKNVMNVNLDKFNYPATENKRILAYRNLKTSDFFTTRNFSILSYIASEFHKIEDVAVRNAALCLLTATSAQCSRLIANRNNLSTGGPAWSVPGFWVPQEHLETNPIIHLIARYKKMLKGLEQLENSVTTKKPVLIKGNSLNVLDTDKFDKQFDLVFLDPPYGDSIPYTEFSHFWNSFLDEIPNVEDDISVSDRLESNHAWEKYSNDLEKLFQLISKSLKPNGKILITFNNNDLKAWKALLEPLQQNSFKCISVNYQIPAVISSKASFCPTSSYISDIYSVYELNSREQICNDFSIVEKKLIKCASSRNGKIPKSVLDREFMISVLENNISTNVLNQKKELFKRLFKIVDTKNKIYELKAQFFDASIPQISELIQQFVTNENEKGVTDLFAIYKSVAPKLRDYGIPELYEFKNYTAENKS